MNTRPRKKETATKGKVTMKIWRQESRSMVTPPTTGPMPSASASAMV